MTKRKLQPGMLTYDDGRPYEEQCREISDNASGKRWWLVASPIWGGFIVNVIIYTIIRIVYRFKK